MIPPGDVPPNPWWSVDWDVLTLLIGTSLTCLFLIVFLVWFFTHL